MKMMALQPGLPGEGRLGVGGGLEKVHPISGAVPLEEQGWIHSWQPLKPHLPSAIKGKKMEHDSREEKKLNK